MEKLLSFPHYYVYIFLTSGVKLHIHMLNVVVQFIVFLTLSILIRRGMDISKCFSEYLRIRDNESRLYIYKPAASIDNATRSNKEQKTKYTRTAVVKTTGGFKSILPIQSTLFISIQRQNSL